MSQSLKVNLHNILFLSLPHLVDNGNFLELKPKFVTIHQLKNDYIRYISQGTQFSAL